MREHPKTFQRFQILKYSKIAKIGILLLMVMLFRSDHKKK